jgi:hypothetical protein
LRKKEYEMRFACVGLFVALVGGCGPKGDGIVVVTVDSTSALTNVATLHVAAATATQTVAFDLPVPAPGNIPPQQTFGIDIPASVTGTLSIHVQARDAGGADLGDGDGMVTVARGARRDVSITLGGTDTDMGGGGGIAIDRNQQAFGNVTVRQSSSAATFVITNNGSAATGTPKLALSGADVAQFQVTTDCNGPLQPAATCTVTASFQPNKTGSNLSASFDVIAIPGGDVSAALTGNALAPGLLMISPMMGSCGSSPIGVLSTTVASFTVTNTGMSMSGTPSVSTSDPQFVASGCASALAPNGTCTVMVQFTPSGLGVKTASLTVMATPGGAANAGLTGTGITGAVLDLQPSSFAFPGTTTDGTPETTLAGTKTFTLTNSGMSASAALGASTLTGGTSASFAVTADGCSGQVLAAGGGAGSSCNLTVSFTPMQAGVNSTTLTVGGRTASMSGHGVGTWHQEVTEKGAFYWYTVWGSGAGDVYVGGDPAYATGASSIYRSTGNGIWNAQTFDAGVTSDSVHALTFVDATHLYALTWSGQVLTSAGAGATWFKGAGSGGYGCSGGTGTCCTGAYASAANNVFIACGVFNASSFVQVWNGSSLGAQQTNESTGLLVSMWGASANDIYTTGFNGFLIQSAGTGTWTGQNPMLGTNNLHGVWGTGPNDVWVNGDASSLSHFNGAGWTAQATGALPKVPTGQVLRAGWSTSTNEVFVVGSVILHSIDGGATWAQHSYPAVVMGRTLVGAWGSSDHDVYAVGEDAALLHYY